VTAIRKIVSLENAKKVLEIATVYETIQWLVGAPRCQRIFMNTYVRPKPGERILDLGCGTGGAVYYLPDDVDYTGIDISAPYIERAKSKHDKSRKFVVADATTSNEPGGLFDRAFSFGVLHHISDDGIRRLLDRLVRIVKPGGVYATIDPCLVEGQHPVARVLISNDRGQHVRNPDGMQKLFDGYGKLEMSLANDLLNVPFTFAICVLTI
jgi:ubiquinone/menaquinone biosynthesis C-methylase UbiE